MTGVLSCILRALIAPIILIWIVTGRIVSFIGQFALQPVSLGDKCDDVFLFFHLYILALEKSFNEI